jgi:GntR family transcriptional regulator, transcriptional repressor for pyruvate dehydrogenase complex
MLKIKPVKRQSLVDTVVSRIREVIEQGHLSAGDRLPTEAELSEQLGVSRTVVREAVSQLESLGLLSVQRGRGMFVGNGSSLTSCVKMLRTALALSPKELVQFTEFRNAIECHAARRAAELATPQDLAELKTLCDDMDRPGREYLEAMRIDFQFHRRLMAITGNELLCSVLEVIQEFVLAAMVQTTPQPRDRAESHNRHLAILRAIRDGDPDAAENAMRAHMEHTVAVLEERERQGKQTRA